MSISRKAILPPESLAHVTFRCLNREFFFRTAQVKDYILKTWKKYKDRYQVQIFEFIIMDNHAHMIVFAPDAERLGDFMRITNSLIARFVNKVLRRDSHALKERYKSPLIANIEYLQQTMQYIWLNRVRVGGISPENDRFCSLYYRLRSINLDLLDDLDNLLHLSGEKLLNWLKNLLQRGLASRFFPNTFEHSHTVGSAVDVVARSYLLRRRYRPPPEYEKLLSRWALRTAIHPRILGR